MEVHEREDEQKEGHDAQEVEPPVRPQERLIHQAENLVRDEEDEAGGESERAGEERGDEGVDLVVRAFAQLVLQELVPAHEERPRGGEGLSLIHI